MTNREALKLLETSREMLKDVKGYSFNMAVMKAEEQLERIKKVFDKISKPSAEYEKYQEEFQKIAVKYCKKKEDGSPDITVINIGNNMYKQVFNYEKDTEAARKREFSKLQKKYKDVLEKQLQSNIEREKELEEEAEYTKPELPEKAIPKDLKTEQFRLVYKMFNVKEK